MNNDHFIPAVHILTTQKSEALYKGVLDKVLQLDPTHERREWGYNVQTTIKEFGETYSLGRITAKKYLIAISHRVADMRVRTENRSSRSDITG